MRSCHQTPIRRVATDMNLHQLWERILDELRELGRARHLRGPCGIDFSSNDYLGLGKEAPPASDDTARSGTASRLLRGQHAVWEQVETELARWHEVEAALVFSSGYVANEGLLSTVIAPGDFVASDACNHASIIDGLRLSGAEKFVYRHNDLDRLDEGLHAAARRRTPERQLFIVSEALFGMDGDVAHLPELVELAQRHEANLIVDEAHSTGCFGPGGSGLIDAAGLRARVCATVHTGGKALGVPGAYVVGSRQLKELLVNRARHFIFTTALPPIVGAWWRAAVRQVQEADARRESLHAKAAGFRRELAHHGLDAPGAHYVVPIILGDDAAATEAARALQEAGFDIRAIRPPSVPPGTARLRIGIHADHDQPTLDALAKLTCEICKTSSVLSS